MDSAKNIEELKQIVDNSSSSFSISFVALAIIIGITVIVLVLVYKLITLDTNEIMLQRVYERVIEQHDFLKLSKSRYSVRDFGEEKVSNEDLELILQAGRVAPTAMNRQPQKIYVLRTLPSMRKIKECCNIYNAPLAILVCVDTKIAWSNYRGVDENNISAAVDATIVGTHMMYEGTSLGLGSIWITGFDERKIINEFELEKNIKPVCVIAFGHYKESVDKSERFNTERKPLEETVKII